MKTTILLTGATGFLGTQIARQILANSDAKIIALLRSPEPGAAQQRLEREWFDWPELHSEIGGRVLALAGDVTLPYLGVDEDRYARLVARVTHIVHAAADIRLFEPLGELRLINVEGTRHVLELARAIQTDHGLTRFGHVSTAYVAGKRSGEVLEEDLDERYGFSTPYEQSKYEAELLVRAAAQDVSFSIFRPGMIVSDSHSGVIKNFNTLYYPLRMYLTGKLRVAPASPDLRVNLVPVDYVASSIARLIFEPQAAGLTFHLTPPPAELPTLAEITTFTREWARQEMGLELPKPWFIPLLLNKNINHGGTENTEKTFLYDFLKGISKVFLLSVLRASVVNILGHDLSLLARLLPYFQTQPAFQRTNTDRLLGPYPHRWQDFFPKLLAYAVYHSFWHRSQRTVHEQILFRLQSQSKPIIYHDLSAGQEIVRQPSEVRAEIETVAAALRALGIQPGERVAILGPNSTRYLACLTASGLIGAVITPFYISCPLKDLETLLQNSQARLFLVGTSKVLQQLDEIRFDGTVVSFCRELPPDGLKRPVTGWPEFLALGKAQPAAKFPPVALDAPAALYYTSGTTGQPKGVVYQHAQLRWVAEALASMYPWYERNRWGSYLSYLPMSHVVEGILAIYSPYYVPAALDLYFLEEFDALPWALQTARPTIFFSVPRFFEKVRVAFGENRLAKLYATLPDGLRRKLLRILLRRGLLRKAGLDRCRQMIVGSAPSIPDLLNFFHDLGVEVHDAYGLTEAPLVSVNRLGHNRIGTVGQPLPETEIQIGADGEIHVRGPQVTAGYYQNGAILPLTEALDTGDIGELSADGYLTLNGRKKDLIITSYAKKISPAPIEAALCGIGGVTHAMLVGEGRPYCTALIWIEENTWSPQAMLAIEAGIAEINTRLSDPEQIKRWAILSGSLTVENGSLTGSMKMKRGVVAGRLATVIEDLYQGRNTLPGVLYSGGIRAAEQK